MPTVIVIARNWLDEQTAVLNVLCAIVIRWLSQWYHGVPLAVVTLVLFCSSRMIARRSARLAARVLRSASWPRADGRAGRKRSAEPPLPSRLLKQRAIGADSDGEDAERALLPGVVLRSSDGGTAFVVRMSELASKSRLEMGVQLRVKDEERQRQTRTARSARHASHQKSRTPPPAPPPLLRARTYDGRGLWSDPRGRDRRTLDMLAAVQAAADDAYAAEAAASLAAMHEAAAKGGSAVGAREASEAQRRAKVAKRNAARSASDCFRAQQLLVHHHCLAQSTG